MNTYVVLLRGVNVGGKALLKMTDLSAALSTAGFEEVRTYIQSGNIILSTADTNKQVISARIKKVIADTFALNVELALFTAEEWRAIVSAAPDWWGAQADWKHNLLVLTEAMPVNDVLMAIGELKPAIERIEPGNGVLYQSLSFSMFGRTTSGKLASNPVYKKMTVRNFNTAAKLSQLVS